MIQKRVKVYLQPAGPRLSGLLLIGLLTLVANSAYLAASGNPNLFYVINSLLHPVIGLIVAVLFGVYVSRRRSFWSGFWGTSSVTLLFISAASGIYLAVVGMTRPHSWALYVHVGTAILGLGLLLFHLHERSPKADASPALRQAWSWSFLVMLGATFLYGVTTLHRRLNPNPKYIIRNPSSPPLSMEEEGGGINSFVFPSSAQTADGKLIRAEFFMNTENCKRCHEDIYNQWYSSMHHFASFNNQWYRKSIEYMQDTIGVKPSLWCGGCHDHALLFSGKMQKQHIREIVHTPEAQAGLTCTSCHAIVQVGSTMGQGGFVIEYPALDHLASSNHPVMRWIHDYTVKLNPKPHRNQFLKPFHRRADQVAEFCSACHKVHLDVPVNNYRWIRGFNDYDNWQASGVSGQGARSFYYPPKPLNCAECHMPLVASDDFGHIRGYVHSHRFAAANTAVPTSYGDKEQIREVEKFLQGALSVDIFALAEAPAGTPLGPGSAVQAPEAPQLSTTFAVGEESAVGLGAPSGMVWPLAKLMAPLNRGIPGIRRGETIRVEVVTRTRRVGHFFPGGTVDAFDCWLELQAQDSNGRVLYWSGRIEDDGRGPVEPGAHFYRSVQLDAHGNPINKRNAWATRALVYTRLIPPGAADTAHFRLRVPEDCGETITLTARLSYRKFMWWNTQWAFAGVRAPFQLASLVSPHHDDTRWVFEGDLAQVSAKYKEIPNLRTVVIAQDSVTLPVLAKQASPFAEKLALDPGDWERWNDYGIGLLLQGDLKGAGRAFQVVTRLNPTYADGHANVARALVMEGNTEAAKPHLLKALELNPRLASARYFYGLALKADGNYAEAYQQFSQAAALYPRDRVVRNQMGRMLFLQRKFREAVAEFQKTLSVDPEDLEAHYNLMLCYRGLHDDDKAAREEKLYLRFKADEAARAITGPYKLSNAHDNNEAQPIHEHVSVPLGTAQ